MFFDPVAAQIIAEVEFLTIELADLAASRGKDDLCRRQILIGKIGQQSPFGASPDNIAEMGRSGAEVADFTRKGGTVMIVKPRIGQEDTLIADFSVVRNADFGIAPIGFLPDLSVEEVARDRHVKDPEDGPEVFKEGQGSPPNGNPGLEVGHPVKGIVNPEVSSLPVDIVLPRQFIPKDAMFGKLSMKLIPEKVRQMQLRLGNQLGIEFYQGIPFAIVVHRLNAGTTQNIHGKPG